MTSPPPRVWAVLSLLLGAYVLLHTVSHGEPPIPHHALKALSSNFGDWKGQEQPVPPVVLEALGVSDYINRVYNRSSEPPVELYVGYYGSQRTGDTIHSPKNCLPGNGWEPVSAGYRTVPLTQSRLVTVNDYVIQKDLDKELVWYWYQGRGRVIANEYKGKLWMMADAITRNRTDGALVRLITPLPDGEDKARQRLTAFAQKLFPDLEAVLPE